MQGADGMRRYYYLYSVCSSNMIMVLLARYCVNIEAIDMLQSALHAVDHSIVMIVGDVNINLSQELPTSWHRAHPCNAYS